MMATLLNIRSQEIAALREKNRQLRRRLADMQDIAGDNDAMVAMMHEVSLLLIRRDDQWRKKAEALLRRGTKTGGCRITIFNDDMKSLAAKTARLPAGGRADLSSLDDNVSSSATYYHLPLKRGRQAVGLVTFVTRSGVDFWSGDDTFCRRLAQLLSSAI